MPKPKIPKTYDDLVPAPYNPREIEPEALDGLTNSLDEFGDLSGITWNKRTGHIVCGHQRVKALRELGAQLVSGAFRLGNVNFEIRIVDWEKAKEKRANVVANSDKITGKFTDGIKDLLAEIKGSTEPSLFEGLRLDVLADDVGISDPLAGDGEIEEDDVPEPPKDPVTKPGDVWMLGDHTVVCGDCTIKATWNALPVPKTSVCFTSPPYNAGDSAAKLRGKNATGDDASFYNSSDGRSPEEYRKFLGNFTQIALARCDGLLVNIQMLAGNRTAFIDWLSDFRDDVSDVMIWDKGRGPPAMAASVLTCVFEFIVIMSRRKKQTRAVPMSEWRGDVGNVIRVDPGMNEFADVHRAVYPVNLPARIIDICNKSNDFVDCFIGTGTTLIACEQLSRRCYGIEMDPAYCDVVVERWEQLTGGKAKRKRA